MSRYFFYLFLNCMFINTIFFVPRFLLKERFEGAIMAMMISIIVSSAFAILFTKAMGKFPGEGIVEIFERSLPGFIRIPLLIFFGVMWAFAGSIVLIAFAFITHRFLNPETSQTLLMLCFCGIGCWAATYRSQSILYLTELVVCLNLPVVTYIMFKSITSKWFDWHSVRILSDYVFKMPSWRALSAATYAFAGYLNMAVYNRMFNPSKIRMLWLIPILGLLVLFASVVVPIGLLGVDQVDQYIYTWITSADTLRMQFGLVERIIFLFLFVYIGFSLSFITITWNIGSRLVGHCLKKQTITIKKLRISVQATICILFAATTFVFGVICTDKSLIQFVANWQALRLGAEMLLVALVVWTAWRKGQKHA